MSALEQIKKDEGFRGQPYKCTAGKTTIGYGRNLDDNPLTIEEAEFLLNNDMKKVAKEAVKLDFYASLNPIRRSVIINMVFNLGMPRFKRFIKMHAALNIKDYEEAAIQMLDSKWARQVGSRATRLAETMRAGQ